MTTEREESDGFAGAFFDLISNHIATLGSSEILVRLSLQDGLQSDIIIGQPASQPDT